MVAIINTLLEGLTGLLGLTTITGALPSYGFINLGFAAPYGALSASGVTNTGPTVITGSLGTTGTSITGFPPGVVTGTVDRNNGASTLAYSSYQNAIAYGRSLTPTVNKAGKTTLDNEVLVAGVYNYDGAVGLTGTVTFDAGGDITSVWVFKIAKTLITGNGSKMILAGGALSSNIFWVVGSSATLGTTSVLQGSILASAAITANTGSTVNGGLYAGASVALQTATVTVNPLAALSFLSKARRAVSFRA